MIIKIILIVALVSLVLYYGKLNYEEGYSEGMSKALEETEAVLLPGDIVMGCDAEGNITMEEVGK